MSTFHVQFGILVLFWPFDRETITHKESRSPQSGAKRLQEPKTCTDYTLSGNARAEVVEYSRSSSN